MIMDVLKEKIQMLLSVIEENPDDMGLYVESVIDMGLTAEDIDFVVKEAILEEMILRKTTIH
jgi:hypothetical protein